MDIKDLKMQPPQRLTAYKLWIASILASPYTKTTGEFSPNYITYNSKHVSRVNIIANVVETFISEDAALASLVIDDGSAIIHVRAFKEDTKLLQDIGVGDLILVVGKIKEYNNEMYILPEIVKVMPLAWGKVRRLELQKEIGPPPSILQQRSTPPVQEPAIPLQQTYAITAQDHSEMSKKILSLLQHTEEGISIDSISESLSITREETNKGILELLKNNDIYQNKPGHYKML